MSEGLDKRYRPVSRPASINRPERKMVSIGLNNAGKQDYDEADAAAIRARVDKVLQAHKAENEAAALGHADKVAQVGPPIRRHSLFWSHDSKCSRYTTISNPQMGS